MRRYRTGTEPLRGSPLRPTLEVPRGRVSQGWASPAVAGCGVRPVQSSQEKGKRWPPRVNQPLKLRDVGPRHLVNDGFGPLGRCPRSTSSNRPLSVSR